MSAGKHGGSRKGRLVPVLALVGGLLLAVLLAALPLDTAGQMVVVVALIGVQWIAASIDDGERLRLPRLVLIVAGLLISLRYLIWRGTYTLYANDVVSLVAVYLLFFAELYALLIHVLGSFISIHSFRRCSLTLADMPAGAVPPSVDVFVPSYNEDPHMLEVTLRAALSMRYPGSVDIFLLDDGGTDEKINDPDPVRALAARERRKTLSALCQRLGVNYIARLRNERAKAGNLNYALSRTGADLVVVFDADHVPAVDFLDRTVPWMMHDPDVFLVQTPHFMINPDAVSRNLFRAFSRMPGESDMFYMCIQRGLDFWGSSYFCGSAALLRRRHLEEVGGLAGESVTEDAETALELHCRGYKSVYTAEPMVAGLAPESLTSFVVQRMRWAQGMTQILLLKRPFLRPGLSWYQRLGYLNSILFWLFPFARTIFIFAPLAYLIFGLEVYNASLGEIFVYTVPHVIATYTITTALYGRTRWPLVSEIYELMQCLFTLKALIKVLVNPRTPSFVVTPKGETLDDTAVSPLAKPFYLLFLLSVAGFAFGLWRLWEFTLTRELTVVVLLWHLFNFAIIMAALGALLELRQLRASPRMPVREKGRLTLADGRRLVVNIKDISAGGVGLCRPAAPHDLQIGGTAVLSVKAHALERAVELPVVIRALTPRCIGVSFEPASSQSADELVAYVFGDSKRWEYFQFRSTRYMPFGQALKVIGFLAEKSLKQHLKVVVRLCWQGWLQWGLPLNQTRTRKNES
ncbi:MAG: UDP-forming cellulose synthase catalytic subunit [Exilibacterium sp.]